MESSPAEAQPQPLIVLEKRIAEIHSSAYDIVSRISHAVRDVLQKTGLQDGELAIVDQLQVNGDVPALIEKIREIYLVATSAQLTSVRQVWDQKIPFDIVVNRKLKVERELCLAVRALRTSTAFAELKNEKIWRLSAFELRQKLESQELSKTNQSQEFSKKTHWYMILVYILRNRYPEKVTSGTIHIDTLREFLCDYIFCVPRETFVGRRKWPRWPSSRRQSRPPDTDIAEVPSPPIPVEAKVQEKPKARVPLPPNLAGLAWLRPQSKNIFKSYFGYTGNGSETDPTSYDPEKSIPIPDIADVLDITHAAVYLSLKKSTERIGWTWELRKKAKDASAEEAVKLPEASLQGDSSGATPPESLPAPVVIEPILSSPTKTKVSLAGVSIPDELPDLTNIDALSQVQWVIFALFYGYDGKGEKNLPSSYARSNRKSLQDIMVIRNATKNNTDQHFQRAILKLRANGEKADEAHVPAQIQPLAIIPEPPMITQKLPVVMPNSIPAPTPRPVPVRVRPLDERIPNDTIQSYRDLIAWVREGNQELHQFQILTKTFAKRNIKDIEDREITGWFAVRTLPWAIILLVKYFEPQKPLSEFLRDICPPQVWNTQTSVLCTNKPSKSLARLNLAQAFASPSLPQTPQTPPVQKKSVDAQPEPKWLKDGTVIPEFEGYEDFIYWASKLPTVVESLGRFLEGRRDNLASLDSLNTMSYFREWADERAILILGTRLSQHKNHLQTLLAICTFDEKDADETTHAVQKEVIVEAEEIQDPETGYLTVLDTIQQNSHWMALIRRICDAHMSGRYDKAWEAYKAIAEAETDETGVWDELLELKKIKQKLPNSWAKKSVFELMFEVCGYKLTQENDIPIYTIKYEWEERLGTLLSRQVKDDLLEIYDLPALLEALRKIPLRVPCGHKEWFSWQEKMASESNLLAFLEGLIWPEYKGRKWWDGKIEIDEYKKKLKKIQFPKQD